MQQLRFHFPVSPVPKARPRVTRTGHCYTPKKTKEFEEIIKQLATLQMHKNGHKMLEGPLWVITYFYIKKPKITKNEYPVTRPDLDNLQKSIWDAVNGIIWKDDSQIVMGAAEKRYSDTPEIYLNVYPK